MDHAFNVEIARDFDVDTAVFLQHIAFWTAQNISHQKHFHKDRFWTYNTIKGFAMLFPYWSSKQMERIIAKAKNHGLLLCDSFNKYKYDRTCWYALSDQALQYFPRINQSTTLESTHFSKSGNGDPEIGTPIPNTKTHIKTIISVLPRTQKKTQPTEQTHSEILKAYHEVLTTSPEIRVLDKKLIGQLNQMIKNWPKYQKDGNPFTIDSFKQYLKCIKDNYPWFINPYVTENGNTKQNNLRVFTRETNITKIVNGEFSHG